MSTTGIVVTIIVVVAIAILAFLAWTMTRRRHLQRQFGPEYDRAVAEQPNRVAAEHDLRAREARHAALELRELTPDERQRFEHEWLQVQHGFVDDPQSSLRAADGLITDAMRARGYPTGNFDERVERLSVQHARTLDDYRVAHDISVASERGEASTEQLRQAVVHYRALAADLFGQPAATSTEERNA